MKKLYILFDPTCALCLRCAAWLEHQPAYFPVIPIARGFEKARALFPNLHVDSDELIAVSDSGDVYRGTSAWLICLYALKRHRIWSFRLSRPGWSHLARTAIYTLSEHRRGISRLLRLPEPAFVRCDSGTCSPITPQPSLRTPHTPHP